MKHVVFRMLDFKAKKKRINFVNLPNPFFISTLYLEVLLALVLLSKYISRKQVPNKIIKIRKEG